MGVACSSFNTGNSTTSRSRQACSFPDMFTNKSAQPVAGPRRSTCHSTESKPQNPHNSFCSRTSSVPTIRPQRQCGLRTARHPRRTPRLAPGSVMYPHHGPQARPCRLRLSKAIQSVISVASCRRMWSFHADGAAFYIIHPVPLPLTGRHSPLAHAYTVGHAMNTAC